MTWDWLITRGGTCEPIDDALKIRDYIDDLPPTAATFRLTDIGINHTAKKDKLLILNDSWTIPDHLTGKTNGTKAVNPKYPHRKKYADAPVQCRCESIISTENEWYDNDSGKCNLDGNCNSLWVAEARAELWKNREDIIRDSCRYLRSPDYVVGRLGCDQSTLGYISKRLHIDRTRIAEESRNELQSQLWKFRADYTAKELGSLFNRAPSTIRRWWK